MKQILLTCLMFAGLTAAHAQVSPGMTHNKWEENTRYHSHKPTSAHTNEFTDTEISIKEGLVFFSGLPRLNRPVYAIITNADGDYLRQTRITPDQNAMSVKRLRHGLYFITIVYKNQSKKAFTMNL